MIDCEIAKGCPSPGGTVSGPIVNLELPVI